MIETCRRSVTVLRRSADQGAPRRGGVAVEFALIAFALYLILAGMLSFGRWMAVQQIAQDAARFAAREVALYPVPAEVTFGDLVGLDAYAEFRSAIYDPDFLVVDLDQVAASGQTLDQVVSRWPVVNQALRPLMIFSTVEIGGGVTARLLHVPGAITDSTRVPDPTDPRLPSGLTVVIPRVLERDPVTGEETLEYVDVLEEIQRPASAGSTFPVSQGGVANLRLNIPFQSAALVGYLSGATVVEPIEAVDQGFGRNILGPGPDGAGPYSGTEGLGRLEAVGKQVRPFRRLIAAQALFRREVVL